MYIYLICSFLSITGDMALLYALPTGLGLEHADLRLSAMMFLIPAVAIFLASFLKRVVHNRSKSARKDYAILLMGIATLEIALAIASRYIHDPLELLLLTGTFVFLYAFSKEGLPRLLYVVSVYRYFAEPKDYNKVLGWDYAARIAATFAGTLMAAYLLQKGEWRWALIYDACTFFLLGGLLLLVGRDEPIASETSASAKPEVDPGLLRLAARISVIVPTLSAISGLFWPHLSLLSERFQVTSAWKSTYLIAVLSLPGLFMGVFFDRIQKIVPPRIILPCLPLLYALCGIFFLGRPELTTLSIVIIANSLIQGLYWPTDYSVRNRLDMKNLIHFNGTVLRRFSVAQFISCLIVILFSPTPQFQTVLFTSLIGVFVVALFIFWNPGRLAISLSAMAAALLLNGCTQTPKDTRIILPSITLDMRIQGDLTYSAFAVMNETSAHMGFLSPSLVFSPQVLERYEMLDGGKRFRLFLNPLYRSARGETIQSEDVRHTIATYLAYHPRLSNVFMPIHGASLCNTKSCALPGITIIDPHTVEIFFQKPQRHFIDTLMNPWFILYKKGKPLTETIGACTIPYQTGPHLVEACDSTSITLRMKRRTVLVVNSETGKAEAPKGFQDAVLLNENPTNQTYPTLTVMTAFANPLRFKSETAARISAVTSIRAKGESISKALRLNRAPLLTPKWMALLPPEMFTQVRATTPAVCTKKPLKILLDTSLPYLEVLKSELNSAIRCPVEYTITSADKYFHDFKEHDIGVAWFTPDEREFYHFYSPFDCDTGSICYFNWKDTALQQQIRTLRVGASTSKSSAEQALAIEQRILENGYAAPISEMNWWIKTPKRVDAIHPSGLAQIHLSDFLDDPA